MNATCVFVFVQRVRIKLKFTLTKCAQVLNIFTMSIQIEQRHQQQQQDLHWNAWVWPLQNEIGEEMEETESAACCREPYHVHEAWYLSHQERKSQWPQLACATIYNYTIHQQCDNNYDQLCVYFIPLSLFSSFLSLRFNFAKNKIKSSSYFVPTDLFFLMQFHCFCWTPSAKWEANCCSCDIHIYKWYIFLDDVCKTWSNSSIQSN